MPLLDLFWAMLWFFLFFLWIWVVVSVLADIFRSDDLNGGGKALWVLFVIFLPALGVLVYLISRGDKMQERAIRTAEAHQQDARAYIRDAAGATSTADEIAKLHQLQQSGAISEQEYQAHKAKLLA
jgi:hypothetical protein